ncbi:MAG: VWA domain-containing protein [Terriglobales bacterium]
MKPAFAAAILLCGVPACAQRPKTPVFRSSTSLVQITVLVKSHNKPVTGLEAGNFTIEENGHQRPIKVFSINDNRPPAKTAVAAAPAATPTATPYTNQGKRQPGMVVVLFDAVDSPGGMQYASGQPVFNSTLSFTWAKSRALAYLRKLPANETVELYGLDRSLHLLASFTSDRQRLVAALKAYSPSVLEHASVGAGPKTGVPGDFDKRNAEAGAMAVELQRRTYAETAVQALSEIAAQVAGLPGRISLIWLLSRPPLSGALVEAALGHNNRIAVYPVDVRGLLAREAIEPVNGNDNPDDGLSPAAAVARLNVQPIGQGAMFDIAQATGGRAFVNTNDIGGAIAAAASDSDYSYTLGFYLPAKDVDNRFHKLRIRVHGVKHAQLRYPHGFWAEPNSAWYGAAPLLAALRNPLEQFAIALKANLSPAGNSSELHLSATLDIHSVAFVHEDGYHNGAVEMVTVEQTLTGKVVGSSQDRLHLHIRDADFASVMRKGLRFSQAVPRISGATTLRLMAEDTTTGATGSLIIPMLPDGSGKIKK